MRLPRILWTAVLVTAVRPASAEILAQAVPVKYNLTARPGETLGRDVAIRNLGDGPAVVRVRLSDWGMDERGNLELAHPGTTPASLQGVVEFTPSQFSLQAGETGVVHVTLRMPVDGPATRYGVLLSEVRPATWPRAQFGPRAVAELGTTLYLSRIPPELTRAELIGLDVTPSADTTIGVAVRVRNPGERHLYSSGEVAVEDSSGAVLAREPLGTGVVLPGATRIFTWTCPIRLAPGRYTVTATLDTGEPELIVGETRVLWPLEPRSPVPVAAADGP